MAFPQESTLTTFGQRPFGRGGVIHQELHSSVASLKAHQAGWAGYLSWTLEGFKSPFGQSLQEGIQIESMWAEASLLPHGSPVE